MKKQLFTLLAALSLFLSSCGCSPSNEEVKREEEDPIIPTDPVHPEDPEDIPELDDAKASTLGGDKLYLFPYYFISRLNSYTSYQSETHGSTRATVWFITTEQSIDVLAIKGDYSYLKNESHSSLVNTVHTAYYHDKKVVYSDGGEYQTSSIDEYLDKYGIYPFSNSIEGYKSIGDGIKSITKLDSEEHYKFKLVFDPEKSTNNVRIQMKAFGGLDKYPTFSNIEMTITVKDDFTPIKLDLVSDYTATKGVDTSCHQEYTVTYSKFNENIDIPNLNDVKDKFNV